MICANATPISREVSQTCGSGEFKTASNERTASRRLSSRENADEREHSFGRRIGPRTSNPSSSRPSARRRRSLALPRSTRATEQGSPRPSRAATPPLWLQGRKRALLGIACTNYIPLTCRCPFSAITMPNWQDARTIFFDTLRILRDYRAQRSEFADFRLISRLIFRSELFNRMRPKKIFLFSFSV